MAEGRLRRPQIPQFCLLLVRIEVPPPNGLVFPANHQFFAPQTPIRTGDVRGRTPLGHFPKVAWRRQACRFLLFMLHISVLLDVSASRRPQDHGLGHLCASGVMSAGRGLATSALPCPVAPVVP